MSDYFIVKNSELVSTELYKFLILSQEDTIQALRLSVEKWETIVAYLKKKGEPVTDGGKSTCALCNIFHTWCTDVDNERYLYAICSGCPIYNKTRHHGCENTPYSGFARENNLLSAQKELEFLQELLRELEEQND